MVRVSAIFLCALLFSSAVCARGGDGGDYSGDGSSSSSSGSDYSSSSSDYGSSSSDYSSSDYGDSDYSGSSSEGDLIGLIFILGVFGIAIGATLITKFKESRRRKFLRNSWQLRDNRRPVSLERILVKDPNFSPVLFQAFAHLVYVKYHESRGGIARRSSEEFAVSPYLSVHLRQAVRDSQDNIVQVIVAEMRIDGVHFGKETRIEVSFKSNVVYKNSRKRVKRMLLREQLVFARNADVLSRKPERVLALGCPSCGSKQEIEVTGRCPSCGQISGNGHKDWVVSKIRELQRPKQVNDSVSGGGGPERGTDLPTIMDPDFKSGERSLKMQDSSFTWSAFTERANTIFLKLQEGWTKRDESILRPFELDHVFDTHRIWLERYREESVRNVLKHIKVEYIKPVKIEHDAWFDAITARVRASMIDYKTTDDGRHLSGATGKRKVFTEYFTFVRRTGRKTTSYEPLQCPQCGAPLDRVSQLGICGYCDSRITTGEFDWVLAMITQDEEYTG